MRVLIFLFFSFITVSCSIKTKPEIKKVRIPISAKSEYINNGIKYYLIKSDTITLAVPYKIYRKAKLGKKIKFFVQY